MSAWVKADDVLFTPDNGGGQPTTPAIRL